MADYSKNMIEGGITLCLSKRVVRVDDQQKNLGIDNEILVICSSTSHYQMNIF